MNRKDSVVNSGIPNSLPVFGRVEPQVGGPDLDAELAAQKNGGQRPAATEVQHFHAGLNGIASVSHSVSHRALAPPLAPARIQSG